MVYYLLYCKYTYDKSYRSITFLNVAFRTSSHSVSFHLKRSAKLYTRFRWWMIACFFFTSFRSNQTTHNTTTTQNRLRSCAKQIVLHHSVCICRANASSSVVLFYYLFFTANQTIGKARPVVESGFRHVSGAAGIVYGQSWPTSKRRQVLRYCI